VLRVELAPAAGVSVTMLTMTVAMALASGLACVGAARALRALPPLSDEAPAAR
jgi:hypothetical protein